MFRLLKKVTILIMLAPLTLVIHGMSIIVGVKRKYWLHLLNLKDSLKLKNVMLKLMRLKMFLNVKHSLKIKQ